MAASAHITPKILTWARERMAFSIDALAKNMKKEPHTIAGWETGALAPTMAQAKDIAQKLKIPLGYLFLSEPPNIEDIPLPDLRTVGDEIPIRLSPDFFDVYYDVRAKQIYYRELRMEDGWEKLPFVGKFNRNASIREVASDMRSRLDIEKLSDEAESAYAFKKALIAIAEESGVTVLVSGVVGNNNTRKLSVKEFRGFILLDDIAPFIFVNGADAKHAQIFTIAHELAHIWIGEEGIVNPDMAARVAGDTGRVQLEAFCNAIAAEMLVPEKLLLEKWARTHSVADNLKQLQQVFRVSNSVLLRRLYDTNLIQRQEFLALFQKEMKRLASKKDPDGGNFKNTMPVRHGRRFTQDIINAAQNGRLLFRDAARLLGLKKVDTLMSLFEQSGTRG